MTEEKKTEALNIRVAYQVKMDYDKLTGLHVLEPRTMHSALRLCFELIVLEAAHSPHNRKSKGFGLRDCKTISALLDVERLLKSNSNTLNAPTATKENLFNTKEHDVGASPSGYVKPGQTLSESSGMRVPSENPDQDPELRAQEAEPDQEGDTL